MIRFRIKGIGIKIDFLFVAVVTVFLLTDKSGVSILALLACIIHEIGHLIMFFLVGYCPSELSFELTGIRLTKPNELLTISKEIAVLLAGSGVNLIVFFALRNTIDAITPASIFAVTHLLVGLFNLLPLKSFDGGKIFELLLMRFLSYKAAYMMCTVINFTIIFMLFVASAYLLIVKEFSFTLLILALYLLIATVAIPIGRERRGKKS